MTAVQNVALHLVNALSERSARSFSDVAGPCQLIPRNRVSSSLPGPRCSQFPRAANDGSLPSSVAVYLLPAGLL
jgi:hypothetical protein